MEVPLLYALIPGALFFAVLAYAFGREKLYSHEDNKHVHKLFGFLCLAHYVYRFFNMGSSDMLFDDSLSTLGCLAIHALLSISSIIFKLPVKRIKEGSRIWPEYRWHSITFAYRSLACMLVVWLEARFQVQEPWYCLNTLIVLCTMASADLGSRISGDHHSSTIQDLEAPPWLRFLFSYGQFLATANCMLGHRRYSLQFSYVWIIQVTAFLMTLRRKNLVTHTPIVNFYGVMIVTCMVIAAQELTLFGSITMPFAMANLACIGRMWLRINKYVLWTIVGIGMFFARQTIASSWVWPTVYSLSMLGVLAIAKQYIERGGRSTRKLEEVNASMSSNGNGNTSIPTNGNGKHENGNSSMTSNGNGKRSNGRASSPSSVNGKHENGNSSNLSNGNGKHD